MLRPVAAPDRTLVERMSRGDEAAFRDLLARYRLTRLCIAARLATNRPTT